MPTKAFDVVIIGAGPAGLFAAMRLAGKMKVLVIDRRPRPGGAGGYTDGKLNLSPHIGLDLAELGLSEEEASRRIEEVDRIFLHHGADPTLHGLDEARIQWWLDRVSWVRRPASKDRWDIQLVPVVQRHMGTDFAHRVTKAMADTVEQRGGTLMLGTAVTEIRRETDGGFLIETAAGAFRAPYLVCAPGREGAYWFREKARALGVHTGHGVIDIGCRVEIASAVYEEITDVLYDPKFIFCTPTHQDRTRTFCTNPGGHVRVEEHGDFRLVNGDALKASKTANTNFAILNTVGMTEPLQDTTEMGQQVARFANFWGGGNSLIVQRWGDLMAGKRSKAQSFFSAELGFDKLMPTLPPGPGVTPGDISFAYPGRIVRNLQESLELLARVIPGVAHPSTTIYVPEIKFYDVRYPTSRELETDVPGLFVAGDGAGKSRGIVGAAVNGLMAAEGILRRIGI
ncbi:MAG: FAD-dependent oxidoreductase [Thiocapsa sp.]|uniref:NAD(P)/FAD-dependent oxidoreductase n=1 Tax=Thiocapsa sp. TaxID=2024551 RepID=UPI001BCAB9C0|nr:FAD-dependent oxidoreductase [Thiocapsa sp.]QVL48349.1 MAG: FAD-dependent oxidoreductase [Thiocapsa sp.]